MRFFIFYFYRIPVQISNTSFQTPQDHVVTPRITLIVAAARNGVIGKNNALPWHLPKDLAYFKRITLNSPIIMGRKTYESIGKALPKRLNIVVTRNPRYSLDDASVVNSLPQAIDYAKQHQPCAQEIHIIGGSSIFAEALPLVDKIYLNHVLADIEGDTYLPTIDWQNWRLIHSEHLPADEQNAHALDCNIYERKA